MTKKYFWFVLLSMNLLAGLTGVAQAQARFSYSANGFEVTDSKTGLIWQRCSAGQSWIVSTCTGTAAYYNHDGALTFAKYQTGWRLPNIKELSSLVNRTVINPSIDREAFPSTPNYFFWSASPYMASQEAAWNVGFYYGNVNGYGRSNSGHVRLVR